MALWLALHLPLLSLEAFCATTPHSATDPTSRPVALLAEHRVSARNAAAAARGVRVGMKRATALALAADLVLGEAAAARDAAALQAVAHAALAFTPAVTLQDGQATVLMEVQASLRLFGGLAALHQRLLQVLAPLAHRVQIAAAPTALGAAVLARWGRWAVRQGGPGDIPSADRTGRAGRFDRERPDRERPDREPLDREPLDRQQRDRERHPPFDPVLGPHATHRPTLARLLERAPVWLLGPAREHWEALQGMGLATLADLQALPRAGLARRFGQALLEDLDRAFGRAPDPRRWLELPTRFEAQLELHHRADTTSQVLAAAAVLLARLVAWAQARQGRIAAFTLAMKHEPRHGQRAAAAPGGWQAATELRIELAEPALDGTHLQLLLRERLARVQLAAPTLELRLRCRDLVAGAPPNGELFPTRGSEALGLARLLERLRARLGDAQVQQLEAVADHRPERASRGVPAWPGAAASDMSPSPRRAASSASPSNSASMSALPSNAAVPPSPGQRSESCWPPLPLHRPVWLLPDPLPLAERHALPLLEGQPLQLLAGPERIEAGWWDGEPAVRDYFIALAADGSLVWVWRRRLPVAPEAAGASPPGPSPHGAGAEVQWMLQGRFA
ncbi:MAG: DNA polymerase Y family protein [Rubrivivax sp.]|nr:DNA polymerase Y family protein [Rubrivivax sp.]